jgi:hypothetical protein
MVLNFESVINRVIFALQYGLKMTRHQGQGHALFMLIDVVKPLLLKLQFLVMVQHKLLVDISTLEQSSALKGWLTNTPFD